MRVTWPSARLIKALKPLPDELHLPALSLVAHAAEDRRPNGTMTDRTAQAWFSALASVYSGIPNPDEQLINGIITRSIIIDYATLDFLANHQEACVTDLGCGFSTRRHRLGAKALWTHVDLPDVLRARCALQPLSNRELVIGRDLCDLKNQGLPAPGPEILFICEGVLNHLPFECARELMGLLTEHFHDCYLIGTVVLENALESIQAKAKGYGLKDLGWGLGERLSLNQFLAPADLLQVWLLGRVASRLGLTRPTHSDFASGVVFLAML